MAFDLAPLRAPRRLDWRFRLDAFLTQVREHTFDRDSWHCGLFAARAVWAMTDKDPAAPWRQHLTLEEGLRALRADGFADHAALAAALWPAVEAPFVQVGDIAQLKGSWSGLPILGVVVGARVAVLSESGLATLPLLVEDEGAARHTLEGAFRP